MAKKTDLSGLIAELELLRIHNPDAEVRVAVINITTKDTLHIVHLVDDGINISSFDLNDPGTPKDAA